MNYQDYKDMVIRTEHGTLKTFPKIVHAAVGMNGEAGEVIDVIKKHVFHGHILDEKELMKELGDVCWYLMLASIESGSNLKLIFESDHKYIIGYNPYRKNKCMDNIQGRLIMLATKLNMDCAETAKCIMDYCDKQSYLPRTIFENLRKIKHDIDDICNILSRNEDITIETIFDINSEKLAKRYPNGFNTKDSIERGDN